MRINSSIAIFTALVVSWTSALALPGDPPCVSPTTQDNVVAGTDALDAFILDYMESEHIPGLAAGIVKNGRLAWAAGYGWADLENRRPVTTDTVFAMASVSKTVTGTALMQLEEQGRFDLDDEVSRSLRYPLAHPEYPDEPITFRQLLTHTTGIGPILRELVEHGQGL